MLNDLAEGRYEPADPARAPADMREIVDVVNRIYHQLRAGGGNAAGADHAEGVRSAEERLRRIVENTPVGICITNKEGRFEYVNPQYTRLYQYNRDELVGRHFSMVVPPRDRTELTELHDRFFAGEGELRGEWEVVRKDGTTLSILADAAHITDLDGEAKKVTFVIDITQRKQVEESLRHANEQLQREIEERRRIERTQREVERIIRHDLRNPLNGVFTASELLARTELNEEQKDLLRIVTDSGRRLKSMIDSSLDLAKMEQGIFTLEPEPVEIQETLLAVQSQLLGLMAERGVTITVRVGGRPLEETAPVVIHGEGQYLENLFANLVRNAVEASPSGRTVTVDVTEDDEHVLFDIHNAGVVPEAVRDSFFERNSSYGKSDGNGIGTYVASLIVHAHAGRIWFTSSEAEGTHVYVRIPTSPVPESAAKADPDEKE
jgi:PAS domain S-box-containing protein